MAWPPFIVADRLKAERPRRKPGNGASSREETSALLPDRNGL